jgi:glycosyltransferase involved in cell wall biosynthesis
VPKSWLVFATSDIEAKPFLHQLDFYLHFPHRQAGEMLSRPALEAAALGCVVVLPERFAARYGDAAVYGEPADAADVIRRYASDPARYAEQSRHARAVVAAAHPPRAFLELVESLLPAVAAARP